MSNLQKRILLVEGDDDKHFVKNFCCRRLSEKLVCKFADEDEENNSNNDNDNSKSVLYIDSRSRKEGGIKNMIDDISLKIKQAGRREAVGILADANGYNLVSCEHPWQRIKTKLEEVLTLEERLPGIPCQEGLILPNVTPKQKPKSTLRILAPVAPRPCAHFMTLYCLTVSTNVASTSTKAPPTKALGEATSLTGGGAGKRRG